jgi:mediator of RNA polymerase II transcription subunit 21
MADRLTQLQDAVDQMATQYFSAIRYIGTHHDAVPVGSEAKVNDENATIDAPDVFEGTSNTLCTYVSVLTYKHSQDERTRP